MPQAEGRVYGRLSAFWETGTEGVQWSFVDNSLPGYDSLFTIDDCKLTILAYDRETPLWEGVTELEYERLKTSYPSNPEYGQQAIFNHWVHGFEKTMEPALWATFFFESRRAILHQTKVHPFIGPSNTMRDRLAALPDKEQHELYRSTMYSWLGFYSDGGHNSLADEWGFSLDEIKRLIGGVTDAELKALKTWPKMANDEPFPFDLDRFTRAALLFGVHGGLDWHFDDQRTLQRWITKTMVGEYNAKELLLRQGVEGIAQVRDIVSTFPYMLR